MGKLITPSKAIDKLIENYAYALKWEYVRKPVSWALYETWKWADQNEKGKKNTT